MTSPHDHHPRHRPWKRLALAVVVVILAIAAAGAVPVKTGEAAVITRFGAPVRVVTQPGLSWILPPPIERAQYVDRRLRTTATGSHGVLTKDGLSLVVQAYAAWRVGGDGATVLRYVRATGSDGDMAANQLRTLLNSSLETVSGRFVLADLVNTDPTAMRLGEYETALRTQVAEAASVTLGVELVQVGIERLLLPEATLNATVTRMAEERRVAAEERQSAGRQAAADIRSTADKDARIVKAKAEQDAAAVEATAKAEAARIYGTAHAADPELYVWLRSLDALEASLGGNARLILATDAPPFQALMTPPPKPAAAKPPAGSP